MRKTVVKAAARHGRSVGGNIGIGYEENKSQGSSRENERAVSYQESTVTAQQTATLTAGGDANISGSKVTETR